MKQVKELLSDLRKDLQDALKPVMEKYAKESLEMTIGKMIYNESSVKVELNFVNEKETFDMYADYYDVPKEAFGIEFENKGKSYKICGIDRKSRKFRVQAKDKNGNIIGLTVPSVISIINRNKLGN